MFSSAKSLNKVESLQRRALSFLYEGCFVVRGVIAKNWEKDYESKQIKDTHREKAPPNKTPAPRKSTNMGVWAVGILNQLFIRGS